MFLIQTCGACPEQYDVFQDGRLIGYLRLRHGHFRAHYGSIWGPVVYEAQTRGDGAFEPDEREFHLEQAKTAIKAEHTKLIRKI